jgi:hypothetical protein
MFGGGGALNGQTTFQVAYRPMAGTFVKTYAEMQGELVFNDFSMLPDSSVATYESMVATTRRVLEELEGAYMTQTTYDSSQARYRIAGREWRNLVTRNGPVGPVRALIDGQMNRSLMMDDSIPASVPIIEGVAGTIRLSFPERALTTGEEWQAFVDLPYTVEIPGDTATLLAETLTGTATASIDSLVVRPGDTLVYVTARGSFNPALVEARYPLDGAPTSAELWGSFASSLLWSTGWQAWVGGSVMLRIRHRIERPQGSDLPDARMTADLRSRFRIRP